MRSLPIQQVEIKLGHVAIQEAPAYWVAEYPPLYQVMQDSERAFAAPKVTKKCYQVVEMVDYGTGEKRYYGVTDDTVQAFRDLIGFTQKEALRMLLRAEESGYERGFENQTRAFKLMPWYKRLFINYL